MTNIYMHEFVFTPMTRDTPTPIREVRVILESEDRVIEGFKND